MPIRAGVDLWNYVGAVFASIGYAATLIWIVKHGTMAGLRRRLAAVGQMAFSNYLFHSMTPPCCSSVGLGLAGRFRLRRARHRRRDLGRAVDRQPDLAPEFPVRASRVAVAHADVWTRAADASGSTNARIARFLNAAPGASPSRERS